jgi:gamma-glutamyl:cysteine ligase YbdK (ATP-grasp superfamily)
VNQENKEGGFMFTLGIEEEFQIVDPETRRLVSHMQEMLRAANLFKRPD